MRVRACLAVAVTLLAVTACKRRPEAIIITRLVLDAPPELDQSPELREAIRRNLVARVEQDNFTRYRPEDRDATHVLNVQIASPGEADGKPEQRVRLRLRPTRELDVGRGTYETVGHADGAPELDRAVHAAFEDAWAVLTTQRLLDLGKDDELIAALGSPDERIKLFAIQRLGERKAKGAVKPLMGFLTEETPPELALRSIGALIAIGDPVAAEPMIELARNKDASFVLQVVFALGALGGRTAEAYLVTLASGHPVEAVRRGAEEALAELSRKAGESARAGK